MAADERWFEQLAGVADVESGARAPARLKSKIYSTLVARLAAQGPLLDLKQTKHAHGHLCVFEQTLTILPSASGVPAMNPCRICHARVLGERMDRAPIFWPGCPYAEFHNS